MPNWIEGTLKLRGSTENLKRFFTDFLGSPSYGIKPEKQIEELVETNFESTERWHEVDIKDLTYIKGTIRAFLDPCEVYWEGEQGTIALSVRQAWTFVPEEFAAISKECELDVRLFGFECGMEFCQEVEIIGGEVIFDNTIQYDDWYWECPMPRLGG